MLNEQKKKGVAVLFIGEDLDVLKSISDRLMVIHEMCIRDRCLSSDGENR